MEKKHGKNHSKWRCLAGKIIYFYGRRVPLPCLITIIIPLLVYPTFNLNWRVLIVGFYRFIVKRMISILYQCRFPSGVIKHGGPLGNLQTSRGGGQIIKLNVGFSNKPYLPTGGYYWGIIISPSIDWYKERPAGNKGVLHHKTLRFRDFRRKKMGMNFAHL